MTTERETARALRALFEDDVSVMPDHVLDAVLAELPVLSQHRGRRWRGSPTPLRFAITAAVLVVAITAGIGLLGRTGGTGGPIASPATPSASPSARPSATPDPTVAPGYASAPPDWPTPPPLAPSSPLPDPEGSPLPADLVGRQYNTDPPEVQDIQAQVLTLRAADDPHCVALYGGRSTCFTILWTPNYPRHVSDPAVRGSARVVDGALVLGFDLVPSDPECEGMSSTYTISADGWTLRANDVPPCSFPPGFVRH
jgi:hypothetical protein